MANALLDVVHLPISRNTCAQAVCCLSLPDAGNIVLLALNGKERDAADVVGSDWATAIEHRSFRKRMFDKDSIDGLQIEFRRYVHDGEIFVVEFAMTPGRFAIAAHKMHEQILVCVDVPLKI